MGITAYSEEIKLPICNTPLINNFIPGLQFSVWQACKYDLSPIIYSNYTNVVSGVDWRVLCTHVQDDMWLEKAKVMRRQHMTLHRDTYEYSPEKLILLIIKFISQGYYLTGNHNAFYVPGKQSYHCYNTDAVYLIYGYNDKRKIFYIIGKTKNCNLEAYEIKYEDYVLSLFNRNKGLFNLIFYKYNDEIKVKPNYSKMHNGIYDYVHSTSRERGVFPQGSARNYIYGMDCYREFAKQLTIMHEHRKYIEPSSYSVLYEHHILMQKRIEFLISEGVIPNEVIFDAYHEILVMAEQINSNISLYNESFNPSLIKQIYTDVEYIIENESIILNNLLVFIKQAV